MKEFVAAIELGSSQIRGIVGKKDVTGNIEILAYASEDSSSFVRRGIIFNLDKAVDRLVSVISKLEMTVCDSISQVYVGINGQSIRSAKNKISKGLNGDSKVVTDVIVNSLYDENRTMKLFNCDILDVIPQEYRIGSTKQIDPVGVLGENIEGNFLNIIARPVIKKNLELCFNKAQIKIADDPFIVPLVVADHVLTESERRQGCALIDFGAGVTTVSIYRKNILRFLSVIPLGGLNITHDLMSVLNVTEDEAERLKRQYGNALYDISEEEEKELISLSEGQEVDLGLINDIVKARMQEIIANVWNQISYSCYEARLNSGLVFTGGAANLANLADAFNRQIEKHLKIRIATNIKGHKITGVSIPKDGSQNALLGLLLKGKENCCEQQNGNKGVTSSVFVNEESQTMNEYVTAGQGEEMKNQYSTIDNVDSFGQEALNEEVENLDPKNNKEEGTFSVSGQPEKGKIAKKIFGRGKQKQDKIQKQDVKKGDDNNTIQPPSTPKITKEFLNFGKKLRDIILPNEENRFDENTSKENKKEE